MEIFKKILYSHPLKKYLIFFVSFFLINNLISHASQNKTYLKQGREKDHDLEKIYFKNSIPFSKYDNFESQLKIFFGIHSIPLDNSYYPDITIINDSDNIREIYKSKLNHMTINKNNYIIYKCIVFWIELIFILFPKGNDFLFKNLKKNSSFGTQCILHKVPPKNNIIGLQMLKLKLKPIKTAENRRKYIFLVFSAFFIFVLIFVLIDRLLEKVGL